MTPYWSRTGIHAIVGAAIGAGVGLLATAGYVLSSDVRHAAPILALAVIYMFARYTVPAAAFAGAILGFLLPVKTDRSFFVRQLPLKLAVIVCLAMAAYGGIIKPGMTAHGNTQNLRNAVYAGNLAGIRQAIEHGANVDEPVGNGTPLYVAAQKGQRDICEYLLSRGADINHRNLSQETALWIAIASGRYNVATLLADSGADVNLTNDEGESPLMLAVRGKNTQIIETLIAKAADVNHVQTHGSYTPLITTIMFDRVENAKLLLDAGANPNLAAPPGVSPLAHAMRKGDQAMIDLLAHYGAK